MENLFGLRSETELFQLKLNYNKFSIYGCPKWISYGTKGDDILCK